MDNTSFNNGKHLTAAELVAYSQGNLSNREMHRLELHLISCELCNDALEGVSQVSEAALLKSLAEVEEKTQVKSSLEISISRNQWMAMAASIALIAVVSAVFYFLPNREETSLAEKSNLEESTVAVDESPTSIDYQEDSLARVTRSEDSLLAIAEANAQQYAANEVKANDVIEEEAIGLDVSDRPDQMPDLATTDDSALLANNIIDDITLEENVEDADQGAAARSKKMAAPAATEAEPTALSGAKTELNEAVADDYITATQEKGVKHFERYIKRSLNYPEAATENNIEGDVVLELSINSFGSITNIDVKQSLGYGCDQEAIRLVREGPNWVAASRNNNPINDKVMVTVPFKLKD